MGVLWPSVCPLVNWLVPNMVWHKMTYFSPSFRELGVMQQGFIKYSQPLEFVFLVLSRVVTLSYRDSSIERTSSI